MSAPEHGWVLCDLCRWPYPAAKPRADGRDSDKGPLLLCPACRDAGSPDAARHPPEFAKRPERVARIAALCRRAERGLPLFGEG